MTVDWTKWLTPSQAQQQELLRRYRETIKREAEQNAAAWARTKAKAR